MQAAISLKSGEEGYRVDMSLLRSARQPDFLPLRIFLCSCYGVCVCGREVVCGRGEEEGEGGRRAHFLMGSMTKSDVVPLRLQAGKNRC